LAFCLARPVLTAMQLAGLGGSGKASVFLLDDSFSMEQGDESGAATPAERAQAELLAIAGAGKSSVKSLSLLSREVSPIEGTTVDESRFARGLDQVHPTAGYSDPISSLEVALDQLRDTTSTNKQLVLASDFRASDWAGIDSGKLAAVRKRLAEASPPMQLTLLSLQPESAGENLSVRFEEPDDFRMFPSQSKRFSIVVKRFAVAGEDESQRDVEVFFEVDGRAVASESLSLAPGTSEQLSFSCEFDTMGWHNLSASLQDAGGMSGDDRAELIVRVEDPIQVVRVQGSRRKRDEGDFLRFALMPFGEDNTTENRFRVSDSVSGVLHMKFRDEPELVILEGTPELPPKATEALQGFVSEGGGLLIFAGDDLDAGWYESWSEAGMLPAPYEKALAERSSWQGKVKFLRETIQNPGLNIFNGSEAGDLYALEFDSWRPIADRPVSEEKATSFTAMRFEDGSPAVQVCRAGDGVVVQCAFSLDENWSNLPQKPVFVPLVQQLAKMACRGGVSPNFMSGETVEIQHDAEQEGKFVHQREDLELPFGSDGLSTQLGAAAPGLYRQSAEEQVAVTPSQFAVQPFSAESDPALLSEAELKELSESLGATLVKDSLEYERGASLRANGREIWRWLLIGLLVLLFAEILLGRLITKGAV
ncbi:MAG: hypothetical protein AAF394_12460, partial [Planctomycetota bacterium]